jgi:hypothetical protein
MFILRKEALKREKSSGKSDNQFVQDTNPDPDQHPEEQQRQLSTLSELSSPAPVAPISTCPHLFTLVFLQ